MNAWIFDSGLFSNPYHFSKQHHKTKQYYYTFIQVFMACLLLSFIFQSHLFQKPSKSISLLCNTHLSAIPLSLYFCHSLQRSSHMVLFTHLAPSHFWKVAFKLQHRKPNYTRPIHTHAHTHPTRVMSQISLCCTLKTPKPSAATISTCPSPQSNHLNFASGCLPFLTFYLFSDLSAKPSAP